MEWDRRPDASDVLALFEIILRRGLPQSVAESLAEAAVSNKQLALDIANSEEARTRPIVDFLREGLSSSSRQWARPRILAFGAYGNGNLGDRVQAEDLARRLVKGGLPRNAIAATSWLRVADFPFSERILRWHAILDVDLLSSIDFLLIGGGGLLAVPHFPLFDEQWVTSLLATRTPYGLVALGAEPGEWRTPEMRETYRRLIAGASFVSGRDPTSVAALKSANARARFMLDPIIWRALSNPHRGREEGRGGVRVVLRPPASESDARFIDALEALYARKEDFALDVIFLEPNLPEERAIIERFPGSLVARDFSELCAMVAGSELGVSMRLHGCAGFFSEGVPVIGLSQKKIADLFDMLGIAEQFLARPVADLLPRLMNRAFGDIRPASMPRRLHHQSGRSLAELVKVIKRAKR